MSRFMCRPARHMCTVSEATSTAATSARTPSHSAWFAAFASSTPAPMLSRIEATMPQCTAGISAARPVFLQVGEADGDDQERFEPFTQGHDECLQHGLRFRVMRLISFWKD